MSFSQYPQNPVIGQEYTVGSMVVMWDGQKFVSVPPAFAGNIRSVTSVDELRTAPGTFDRQQVSLTGYYAGSTKGGGILVWDATSTAADDGGVTFAVAGVATGRWVRQLDGFVTPEMFGATGSGDEHSFISNAITTAAALDVELQVSKVHDINNKDLELKSNSKIAGVSDGAGFVNAHVFCAGSFGDAISITAQANPGDLIISLNTAGLVEGDYYRLTSTLNCNSSDAGTMRLGDRVSDRSFFAEYVRIRRVIDANSVELYSPILFMYPTTTFPDTNSNFLTTSILRKVNFVKNIKLKNIKVVGKPSVYAVYLNKAQDYLVENCHFSSETMGAFECLHGLDGKVRGGRYEHTTLGSDYANSIPVKFRSSSNCGISDNSVVVGGHQGIDYTYQVSASADTELGGPSINCYAISNKVYGCTTDTITTHPGTYGGLIEGNTCYGKQIRIRSPYSKVKNNFVSAIKNDLGILIGQEFLYGSEVCGNTVIGSLTGIRQTQSDFSVAGWDNSAAVDIYDNTVIGCGVAINVDTDGQTAVLVGSRVFNNRCYQDANYYPMTRGVNVGSFANGVSVFNNDIKGATESGIRYASNTTDIAIYDNRFSSMSSGSSCVRGSSITGVITNTTVFPAGEVAARMFLGRIVHDGSAGTEFLSTSRNDLSYRASRDAGFQDAIFSIKRNLISGLGLGTINIWLDMTTTPKRLMATFNDGTGTKNIVLGEYT